MTEMLRTSVASLSSTGASLAGAPNASLITRHFGIDDIGLPELDMIRPSDRTRSGWLPASTWAIIPPIDAPTTCARSMPRWSSSPLTSSARSTSVYGTGLVRPTT